MRIPALLGAVVLCGCHADLDELRPLVGHWTAADPRYEQCSLRFSSDGTLLLEQGGGQTQVCWIHEVAVEDGSEANARCYRIEYEAAGGASSLALLLDPQGLLRLRNRQEVAWTKNKGKVRP